MSRVCEFQCSPETCPPGNYYVTCRDAGNSWFMAGPYTTHAEALANVDKAMHIANNIDGKAWFMSWGTALCKNVYNKPGKLHSLNLMEEVAK